MRLKSPIANHNGSILLSKPGEAPMFYSIRRSLRAQKTRIVVTADKIEVVAPPKVSEQRIKAFVSEQQHWIKNAIKRIELRTKAQPSLAPIAYVEGSSVPYQGRQLPLSIKPTTSKTLRVQLHQDQQFLAYLPVSVNPDEASSLVKSALERWMKQQARLQAGQIIDKHGAKHQLYPRSLRIKTQKSRWGSCGPDNDINLNWLLMLAPAIVMEYVVVHELCHIRHKNHSKDFWLLVAEHMPDYLTHRRWLKANGASLMRGL